MRASTGCRRGSMKPAEQSAPGARILPWPRLPAQRGGELEFLPAALEIIETPASPAGRAIAVTIILFFVVALAWASLGSVDVIATAQGRIVPTGRTKIVQPVGTMRPCAVAMTSTEPR